MKVVFNDDFRLSYKEKNMQLFKGLLPQKPSNLYKMFNCAQCLFFYCVNASFSESFIYFYHLPSFNLLR